MTVNEPAASSILSSELPQLTPAQRQVAGVLAEVHDATVLEITSAAGVSKSAAAKTLTMLESVGAARRAIHSDGDVRMADTWSPTPLTGVVLTAGAGLGGPEREPAEDLLPVEAEPAEDGEPVPAAMDTTEPEAVETALDCAAVEPSGASAVMADEGEQRAPERLASGGLAAMVAEVLATHPDIDYTPTMISHLLGGRSSGAITNALERQVKAGAAVKTCEAPKRYRHAL